MITIVTRSIFSQLLFSRLLGAIVIANVATLSVCNLLAVSVPSVRWLYPVALLTAGWLLSRLRVRPARITPSTLMVFVVSAFAIVVVGLRLPYILEWLPGNVVHVGWDDYGRLAQLTTMTLSEQYPLPHFANDDYLFSFYYTALYPLAWLKLVLPILTLKDTLFLGQAMYTILFVLSLIEVACHWMPSRASAWVMILGCTCLGGFDWIMSTLFTNTPLVGHHEWWQAEHTFHGNAQIPSPFSMIWWAFHHHTGYWAAALALVFATRCRAGSPRQRLLKSYVVGLMLVAAFYTSVFAFMPVMLFLLIQMRTVFRRLLRLHVALPLIALALPPLFLFTHKMGDGGFTIARFRIDLFDIVWLDRLASFPIWIILMVIIEFGGLPILAWFTLKNWSKSEKKYAGIALIYFLSTYAIAYSGANNYAMRGMALPSLVMIILLARHLPDWKPMRSVWTSIPGRGALITAAAILSIGTALEMTHVLVQSERNMKLSHAPADQQKHFPIDYRTLARDQSTTHYVPAPDEKSQHRYNAEKLIEIPIDHIDHWETELMRHPRTSFFH